MMDKKGAGGSPSLSPLENLNSYVWLPFTSTKMEHDSMHPLIHIIHLL